MGLFKRHGKLSPKARAKKYHQELKNKVETGVNGHVYTDDNGCVFSLSDTQLAYRSGYVNARKDIRLASKRKKAKNGKKKKYGKSSYGYYGKSNWKKNNNGWINLGNGCSIK